jgi:Tfp pilus assembly protein PilF
LKKQQYSEALVRGENCLKLMPRNPECMVLMAAVYARLNQPDKAADYYRKFLEIAPDHRLAPKVRETLHDYETTKK